LPRQERPPYIHFAYLERKLCCLHCGNWEDNALPVRLGRVAKGGGAGVS